jgi:hypothetical protein
VYCQRCALLEPVLGREHQEAWCELLRATFARAAVAHRWLASRHPEALARVRSLFGAAVPAEEVDRVFTVRSASGELRIAASEIFAHLSLSGRLRPLEGEIINRKEAVERARRKGLRVRTAEVQRALDALRNGSVRSGAAGIGGHVPEGLTADSFVTFIEEGILLEKLRRREAGERTLGSPRGSVRV